MVTDDALAIARKTAKKLAMGADIVDASGLGDVKHDETTKMAESIEKADCSVAASGATDAARAASRSLQP